MQRSHLIPATIDKTVSPRTAPIFSPRGYQTIPITPTPIPIPSPIIIPDPPPIYIPPVRTPTPSPVPSRKPSPVSYRVASPVIHHIIDTDLLAAVALWQQTVAMMNHNLY